MWIFCQTGANFVATVKFAQVNCLPTDLINVIGLGYVLPGKTPDS